MESIIFTHIFLEINADIDSPKKARTSKYWRWYWGVVCKIWQSQTPMFAAVRVGLSIANHGINLSGWSEFNYQH